MKQFLKALLHRRSSPPRTDLTELDHQFIRSIFVNRESAIEYLLQTASGHANGARAIVGPPGIGKTWVLMEARERLPPTRAIIMNEGQGGGTTDLVRALAMALHRVNVDTPRLESVISRHTRAIDIISRSSGNAIISRLEASPAAALGTEMAEHISMYLRGLLPPTEAAIALQPEVHMVDAIIQDLSVDTAGQRPIIILDDLDSIRGDVHVVRSLLRALSSWTVLFVSGGTRTVQAYFGEENCLPLDALSRDHRVEAIKRHLDHMNMTMDDKEVSQLADLVAGLPGAIRILLDLKRENPLTTFDSTSPEIGDRIVEVVLKGLPAGSRDSLLVASVPRFIDPGVQQKLRSAGLPPIDAALAQTALVMRVNGRHIVDPLVRPFLEKQLRMEQPEIWRLAQEVCCEAHRVRFEVARDLDQLSAVTRRLSSLEFVHHSFRLSTATGVEAVVFAAGRLLELSELDACSALLEDARAHPLGAWDLLTFDYLVGEVAFRQARWAASETSLQQVCMGHADHPQYAAACITLGRQKYAQGDFERAESLLKAGEAAAASDAMRGYAQEQRAKVLRMQGVLRDAVRLHESAIELSRRSGSSYSLASTLGSYGTTLIMSGSVKEGCNHLLESVVLSEGHGFKQFECTSSRSLAWGLYLLGDLGAARARAYRSHALAVDLGDGYNEAVAQYMMCAIDARAQKEVSGHIRSTWDDAVTVLNRVGATVDEGNARLALAETLLDLDNDPLSAHAQVSAARDLFRRVEFRYGLCWAGLVEAQIALRENLPQSAADLARTARDSASQMGALRLLAEADNTLASIRR